MDPTEHILDKFIQLSAIPRCTGNEAGIRAWLQEWAACLGFTHRADAVGNLVIQVPPSRGYEHHPALILQAHLDMVCQKTPDSAHDFNCDPIRILREGDWVKADGTTLGADNGIGIAMMLTLVEEDRIVHPALELLLTVAEENGLVGADRLDADLLTAKTLVNLDSEMEGVFTVGCAGGGSLNITLPLAWEERSSTEAVFELTVTGLLGGHSGGDINKQRANANKLLARVLERIQQEVGIRLAVLKGGTVRNAIPREAKAIFACSPEQAEVCCSIFNELRARIESEFVRSEPGLLITLVRTSDECFRVVAQNDSRGAVRLLIALPNGVSQMSAIDPGLVDTSNNIGVVELLEDGLHIISSQRSADLERLEGIISRVEEVARLAGALVERTKIFPPWQSDPASPIRKRCTEIYPTFFDGEPIFHLTHGGLECGVISARCGGLDAISLGPTIVNLHSPEEKLFVPSLRKTWDFLTALVKSL